MSVAQIMIWKEMQDLFDLEEKKGEIISLVELVERIKESHRASGLGDSILELSDVTHSPVYVVDANTAIIADAVKSKESLGV